MVYGAIFAGGYGKRLRPFTDEIPKVLLTLRDDYTILDKQLMDFKNSEINHVFLLVGHKWQKIKKRYGNEWKKIKLEYLVEKKPMGTLWALKNCAKYLDDDVVLRNGDTVSDFNIKKLVNFSKKNDFEATIALTRMKSPYAIIEFEDNRIKSFVEKPFLDHYINAGLYYFKKSSFRYLNEEYTEKEIEKTFIPKLVSLNLVGAFIENVKWFPVDNFKDLEEVRNEYKNRKDTEFGYIKNFKRYKEIFVKESYSLKINLKGKLKLIEGKGIIDGSIIKMGEEILIDEKKYFEAKENSKIIIIS